MQDRETFRVRGVNLSGKEVPIRDSLAILQNDCTSLYWVLDCHDWTAPWDIHPFVRDLRCRGVLKCQFRPGDLKGFRSRILRPWTYFDANWPAQQERQTALRSRRRTLKPLYFRGLLWEDRKPIVEILQQRGIVNPDHTSISYSGYLEELAASWMVLSLPGCGDFCHRDVEAFAAGTCVLRPKVRNRFHENLRADFHYISVDADFGKDPPEEVAARIEERYWQVVDCRDYMTRVAGRAADWYDRNVRFPQSMELTARLLGWG